MEESDKQLIIMLCTGAGMLMEDAIAVAVTIKTQSDLADAIEGLQRNIELVLDLIAAAGQLCEQR